jgi:hypothetical protein
MRCPKCNLDNDTVYDSRSSYDNRGVWRRRRCKGCGERWTTEELPGVLIDSLINLASTYLGIDDAMKSASSDSREVLAQLFKLRDT